MGVDILLVDVDLALDPLVTHSSTVLLYASEGESVSDDRELLAVYLEMGEDDLTAEIAVAADPDAVLHSPDALLAKGRAVIAEFMPRLRELVCPYATILEGPEVELALAVSGFLVGGVPGALIQPLAAYIVKRGLRSLCAGVGASA